MGFSKDGRSRRLYKGLKGLSPKRGVTGLQCLEGPCNSSRIYMGPVNLDCQARGPLEVLRTHA
eukprot:3071835-Pyramimonas_sp.AAC.1